MVDLRARLLVLALLMLGGQALLAESAVAGPCDPPNNEIVCENSKPGTSPSVWDVNGAGASNIQGFSTDISVGQGQTIQFKVNTPSANYRLDIYRMGYYGGDGARKVASVEPSASLPQSQPPCDLEPSTGLVDCGGWSVSASWAVPATAVSGIYFAKLEREDAASEGSHIVFVVRDDDGESDLLFQTSDTTWQAYNQYGGNSLYVGGPGSNPSRAYKVSYNRPLTVRQTNPEDAPFNAEYPMVRWLERNGYDVSYASGVDTDRAGEELLEHEAFLSVGHDEYWTAEQRANVEAARDAGVDLAFFSGNEIFWKTRWEESIGGPDTDHRTLVCYKETHANGQIDPEGPDMWTGTWRDPRFSPPADGGRPENALSGTAFMVNAGTTEIQVPAADGAMRLWRDTDIANLAPGETATLGESTLGYEWDEDLDNGFRPEGLVRLSSTTAEVSQKLLDHGNSYDDGTATHHLTLYRAASGALVFSAGTVQWAWGLDAEHDRGNGPADARMQQATVNLFADMGVQPQTLQAGLAAATPSGDDAPPGSTIGAPAEGGEVELGQAVTISGTAADSEGESHPGGAVGAVEVSVDGGETWHPAEGRDNWTYSWFPEELGEATILSRAADDSGNLEPSPDEVTVDVVAFACPCSIWNESFSAAQDPDTKAVELGVKFRADTAGYITGLRFYKTAGNTGAHSGRLWTKAGVQLAQVTFSGETPTGWQQAKFDNPVAVAANTTYVASYHAPAGRYASQKNYFSVVGFDNPPLHALANGVDGPNGIYEYGPPGGLFADGTPSTFQSENYLVDVVFEFDVGPDVTPPQVTSLSPVDEALDIGVEASVGATFDEGIDPATVSGATVQLRDDEGGLVAATVGYEAAQRRVTLDPSASLLEATTYTATIKGGPTGVKDVAGNPLAANREWSFTTVQPPPPPPDQGPGGPILVISNTANPFSRYYGQILEAEGLNEYSVVDVSTVTPAVLAARDVAILGEGALSAAQAQILGDWVQAGGNLIAMRPDPDLNGLLGLGASKGSLGNGYIQVDTGSSPGAGIVGETIQFHGSADRYATTGGAETVATLFSNASTSTGDPAVTLRSVGPNGGHAAAFTYDLARSIVYTRQGNPAWNGQERDGLGAVRSDDLFFGAKAGDVQPDWIDFDKVDIPQADEQQRLLTNLIGEINLDRKPLPRFWFLPRDEKAAVVMTGDDHGHDGTSGRFESQKALDPPGCSVAEWECVRSTSYIYPNTPISDAKAAQFVAEGFEVGLHVTTGCNNWDDEEDLETYYDPQLAQFAANFPSLPPPRTSRTHCIVWSDWATQPKVELKNGIRLDTTYYYWPASWVQNRPGMFTGSGMPMRFVDLDGSLIDVYQATTQMTDESEQAYPFTSDALLDRALGSEGYYGVFTANMHTDKSTIPQSTAIVSSAMARGVPIVSARQMLTWLDGRNQSSFGSIGWDEGELSFTIDPGEGANGLRAMVPVDSAVGPLLALQRGGSPVATTTRTVKGVEYAFFDAEAGSYTASYVDAKVPVISNVQVAAGNDGTATVSWQTNEPASSRVDYGTNPSSLTLSKSSAALVTSHSVQLTGLNPSITYHFRVTSADGEANAATEPDLLLPPQSFATPPPAPALSATVPASPANQNSPKVVGSAAAGTTVSIYAGAGCTGSPVATGTAAGLVTGIAVAVVDNTTTTFRATATSGAGTSACSAPLAYVEDSGLPDTQVTVKPAALSTSTAAKFEFTGSDGAGSGIASFQCKLDGGAFTACSSGVEYTSLAEGAHSFEVKAIDKAGNVDGSPATHGWTVDSKAPDTTIGTKPAAVSTSTTAKFEFSGSDPGGSGVTSFQCKLDSGSFAACNSGVEYPSLAEGSHSFEVRAIDQAGNVDASPATHGWQVDLTPATVQIDSLSKALLKAGETSDLTWHANENGSFQLRVGGADCDSGTTIDSGAYGTQPAQKVSSVAAAQLAEGANTLRLCLTDAAGNRSSATTTIARDTGLPDTQITAKPAALVNSAKAIFSFTGSDPGGSGVTSFQCKLDSGTFTACSSGVEYTSLAEGSHSFEVRAIDQAGNVDASPATHSWTIDLTPPTVQIDSISKALLKAGETSELTWHANENGSFQLRVGGADCDSGTTIDSGPYGTQPAQRVSSVAATQLAEGANTLRLCLTDAAGNRSSATTSVSKDTGLPDTQITTKPAALVNGTSAKFEFNGNDGSGSGIASFECKLDSGSFTACASGVEFTSLAEGSHSFEVRAIDLVGNVDATPATHSWQVDTQAPETEIAVKPPAFVNSATAKFEFTGSDPGGSGLASFQCRRDSTQAEDWQPCSSPRNENSLADGLHVFEVRAVDKAGNVDSVPATHSWTIDTKAPDTQISAKPASLTNSPIAGFSFSGDDGTGAGIASFECKLDSGAFTACASGIEYISLAEGSHSFEVRAIDKAGNVDASAAIYSWQVDLTPPSVQIDGGPTGLTNDSTPTFAFSAPGASFECSVDKGTDDFKPCSGAGSHTPVAPLADGAWTFRVRATDSATNQAVATRDFTVDSTNPDTQITAKPAALVNATKATFEFSGNDGAGSGIDTFQCKLDSGSFAPCASGVEYTGLSEGSHSFEVHAIDKAGNVDASPATHSWQIDLTPPTVQIDTGPSGLTNDATPTFAFSSEPGATFECSIDKGTADFKACSAAGSHTPDSPLTDGPWTFRVRATDSATNQAVATREFTVDATNPDTQITANPAALVNATSASFSFTGSDGAGSGVASFQCKLDSGSFSACSSGHEYTSLADGAHTFEVRAIDQAGNIDATPASFGWTVDSTVPQTQIDSGPPAISNSASTNFVFHGEDPGGSGVAILQCRRDSTDPEDWLPCSSPRKESSLAEGSHTFEVRAIDVAGNVESSPAVHAWTIDTNAPDTQITAKPALAVNAANATFSFTGNDGAGPGIASFQCKLDSGSFAACNSGVEYTSLAEGNHSFEVRAIDKAGNVDASPAVYTWTIDLTPATVQIDSLSKALLKAGETSELIWHANENGNFQLRVGGADCDSGTTIDSGAYATQPAQKLSNVAATQLAEGANTLRLCLTDAAGNRSSATTSVSKDTGLPDTQITTKPAALVNTTTAKFEFTGNDGAGSGIASFQCKLDSGSFGPCSSGVEYTSLAEGSHSFEVRAIDQAGNVDATPATHSWTIDLTPPAVQIDSGPAGITNDSTPTFAFSAPGATFECSIDKGTTNFGSCSGAGTHTPESPLIDGLWIFRVRATDAATNQAVATREFTVDATVPDAPELSATLPPSPANHNTPKVIGSAPADTTIRFYATPDCSGAPLAIGPSAALEAGIEATVPDNATTVFRATATSAGGTTSLCSEPLSYLEDSIAPDTQITAKPVPLANSAKATFAFNGDDGAGSGITSFQCKLDSGSFTACASGIEYTPLAEGNHSFEVRAIDQAGNLDGDPALYAWQVDLTPPAVQIDSGPTGLTNDATPTFAFSAPGATFECSVDKGIADFKPCSGTHTPSTPLADGAWTFRVRATDAATNQATATRDFTVDATAPDTQIGAKPAALVSSTAAKFEFTGNDGSGSGIASFECKLDAGAFTPCSSGIELTSLAEGSHSFEVRAIDKAGNVDASPATHTWTIDLTPATVQIDSLSKALLKAGETSELTWHANENGSFQLRVGGADCDSGTTIDSGAYANQPNPKASNVAVAQLAEGANTLRLCLTDAAGNRSSATTSVSKDTGLPDTQITAKPAALVNATTATFSFTGNDGAGSGIASFQCKLDSGAFAPCASGVEYVSLAEGSHSFEVRAIDKAGNVDATPATHSWTIDLTPPTVQIDSGPSGLTNDSTPSFTFSSEPSTSFECSVDKGIADFKACSGAGSHTPSAPLADGSWTFRVRATDAATNQALATRDFTVDTAAPAAPELSATLPASPANHNTPKVIGSAPVGTTVKLYSGPDCSGAPFATVTPVELEAGVQATVADDSTTSFRATATSAAENTSGCSEPVSYVEDSTGADTQITAKPTPTVNATAATFSFTGNDGAGSGIASFQCKLDSGSFAPCASGVEYVSLAEGSHSFEVRAIDKAGNVDANPATFIWSVDTTAPTTQIDSGPAAISPSAAASFVFHGADPGGSGIASVECRRDAEDWTPCGSPRNYSALAEGNHTFEVRAIDNAGNVDSSAAVHTWTIDTLPPETQIAAKPAALVNGTTAKFEFNGNDGAGSGTASFQCKLDSGSFGPCSSGVEYTSLAEGSHSFEVRAIDQADNVDATPATHTWTIDLTPPTVQIDSGPSGLTNDSTPSFAFSAPGATFECSIDKGAADFKPCSAAGTHTPAAPLADGLWTFRVRATDSAANQAVATRDFTVDTAAPPAPELGATLPASPANDNNPKVFGSAPAGTTIRLYAGTDCSGALLATVPVAALEAGVQVTVVGDSTSQFSATATTAAENTSGCSEPISYLEDSTAPDTLIGTKPPTLTNATAATFSFTGDAGAGSGIVSFKCKLDAGAFTPCISGVEFTGLAEGAHSFEVRAIDQAGNVDGSPATHSWTVDLTPPNLQIDSLSKALLKAGETSELTWHANENGNFQLRVGGADCDTGTTIDSSTYTTQPAQKLSNVAAAQLAEGANTLRLCLTDAAGNRSSATTSVNKDTGLPDTQITAKPAALVNATTAKFEFNGNDGAGSGTASFQCKLDSGSFGPCSSGVEYTSLAEGSHSFEVRAIDQADNVDATPATHTWTIDLTPPTVQIDSGPSGLTNDSTPSFAFSAPGATFECSIDKGAADFKACSAAGTHTPAAPLADGLWTFRVRATDSATNQAVATRDFTVDTAAPPAPELSATFPASPANHNTPKVIGSAPAGTTVKLYAGADCTGSPLATATATELEAGVEATVADNSTTSFRATATSTAENTSGCSEPISYTEDSAAPDTQIGTKPGALTNATAAIFSFTGNDGAGSGIASFECKLDSGAFAPCSSGIEYTSLAEGAHSFEVRAIDQAGNVDGSPATHSWTVDLTPPNLQIDSLSKTLLRAGETSELIWHANENGNFQLRVGGTDCDTGTTIDSGAYANQPNPKASNVAAAQLAEGANTLRLCLSDAAGNRSSATTTIAKDTGLPDTQITAKPAALVNATTAKFEFNGNDGAGSGIALFQCKLDSGSFAPCASGVEYTSLAEGSHSFEVRAIDQAGNVDGSPATHSWQIDLTPPTVQIDTGPTGLTNDSTPTFAFSSELGATFECSIDKGTADFKPCSAAGTHTPSAPLADGSWTFRAQATDAAGNQATATRAFSVDTTAPSAPTLSATLPASPANDNNPKVLGSAPTGTTIRLYAGAGCSGALLATVPVAALEAGIEVSVPGDSTSQFSATATTGAGNTSGCSEPISYLEDSTAPDTQIGTKPTALVNGTSASFSFTGSDSGGSGIASFQCKLDSGSFATCTSAHEYTSLSEGSHSFQVRALDNAGNADADPATYTWQVDLTPPTVQIDSGPTGLTNDPTPTFAFSAPGATFECSIDKGTADFKACSGAGSHTPAAPLADGLWTFRVRAIDAATNQAVVTRAFTVDTVGPAAPALSATVPASPANQNSPKVVGSAPASTTIRLYANPDCAGVPAATVPVAVLEAGIQVTVADDTTTQFSATATTAAENTSGCSAPISYAEDSTGPGTQIDSHPASISTSTEASFSFQGSDGAGSGVAAFECRRDSSAPGAWVPCSSPQGYSGLGEGAHSFEVRAIDKAGNPDPSPASFIWTVDTTTSPAGEPSPPPPPPPAGEGKPASARFLRIVRNPSTGKAVLVFEIPGPGRLSVRVAELAETSGRGAASKTMPTARLRQLRLLQRSVKPASVRVDRAGEVELPIELTQVGKKLLREDQVLKVRVLVRYDGADGSSTSWRIPVTLKKRPAGASKSKRRAGRHAS